MSAITSERYDVAALKRDHPVADVLASLGIELRPAGRALVGRCPFHDDQHRPNLHVYVETQSWYCYRCGIGGDILDLIMRHERIDFPGACAWLATKRARAVSARPTRANRQAPCWDRLVLDQQVVMNTAAALYQNLLWREPRALAYVRERGIPDWTIRAGGLGFADGHSLEAYLRRRGGLRTADALGLLRRCGDGDDMSPRREFLAGRIVVPERRGGNSVWFIGRALDERSDRPKYLALGGERPLLGLERVLGKREVYVCEGVFDYLTAISWRLPALSLCGTHIQLNRLGFLAAATTVFGLLDGDPAGAAAAAGLATVLGRRWCPVTLPDGLDLNDLGRLPDGRSQFLQLVRDAREREGKGGTAHAHRD